jgi:hypothetical protein
MTASLRTAPVSIVPLTILIVTIGLKAQAPMPPAALIADLDQLVQDRLADTRMGSFGISRVLPAGHTDFKPESDCEDKTVNAIAKAGWDVTVYFGSLGLMQPVASAGDVSRGAPVVSRVPGVERPQPAALREEAKKAFEAFSMGASAAEFRAGSWYVAVRPVRASAQSCVDCHNRRRVIQSEGKLVKGDLLGVSMYAFLPRR